VISAADRPPPDSLRKAEEGFMPDPAHYLQLPELPDRIGELADSLTGDLATRYDKARAVETWLREEFRYTLELPARASETSLDHFLFERRAGHCEYFSSAMVVLLRSQGVHARNVNGFLGGHWSEIGEYLAVTQNEAHSWVEVWFPGYGWVPFDPTPSSGRAGSGAVGWSWPGRLLLDALQHRWSTWVLDYDVRSQSSMLRTLLSASDGATRTLVGSDVEGRPWTRLLLVALALAVIVGGGLFLLRRDEPGLAPESLLYLRLVRACQKAGLDLDRFATPFQLVARLRERSHPATAPASRVVDRYLRSRFAGETLPHDAIGHMAEDLRSVRRHLRREPWEGG